MTIFNKKLLSLALMSTLIASCGVVVEDRSSEKIGPTNDSIKGYIIEDMTFSGKSLEDVTDEEKRAQNWHHYDLDTTELYGVSSEKAYTELALKQGREIIVAVIDSGVDIKHEDLQGKIWINKGEIANNGIDDDGNGYIDDVNGWNFLGGSDGRHVNNETLEQTRIYGRLLTKLQSGKLLTQSETILFETVKNDVETELKSAKRTLKIASTDKSVSKMALAVLKEKLGIEKIETKEELVAIESNDEEVNKAKKTLLILWDKYRRGLSGIDKAISRSEESVNVYYNVNFKARAEIVGDDPSDFTDTNYGNNDVKGPDSFHGTHVSGIIAAIRNNELGGFGIAKNVKIMVLRAVPNGDERDKDIALAVKYAADNGAHIINMSFGKKYSPYKAQVDAAFEYAAQKGLLLIHAAGNSAKNVDGGINNYPNSYKKFGTGVLAVNTIPNWIEVGASTKDNGLNLPAAFSNYGDEAVTLFAPGHKIYNTAPENEYVAISGTSMACPVTAGVAAMLMSEFPTMTAFETKNIMMETVSKPGVAVRMPSETAADPDFRIPVLFGSLSVTDGVVNAFTSLVLAKELAETK